MAKLASIKASSQATREQGLTIRQRMQAAHQTFQAVFQNVRIDLRGRDVGVSQQRLHHAQVGAVVQQVAGKSVPQYVRADLFRGDGAANGQRFELAREVLAGQVALLAE